MDAGDYLYTMAEVAVAFVGFSAIISALRQSTDDLGELERGYMSALVSRSLAVLGFSLLPSLLIGLGFDDAKTILFSSGLLGLYMIMTAAQSTVYHYSHPLLISISSFWLRAIVDSIIGILQIGNAIGFHHGYPLSVYMAGVSVLLIAAGLSFVAMLQTEPGSGFDADNRRLNIFGKHLDAPGEDPQDQLENAK